MLTPEQIYEKSFQTTGRGSYKADDVDSFMNEVSSSYEKVYSDNNELLKKINILAKKIEEYREEEDSLRTALLNAQKLADKIVSDAKEIAKKEISQVKAETDKLRSDAKTETDKLRSDAKADTDKLVADSKKFADDTRENAKKEADEIVSKAKKESEEIVKNANMQSDEILGAVNRKVTHESLVYEMVQKEASEFKSKLVAMYKEHINLINKLPDLADEKLNEQEKKEETV